MGSIKCGWKSCRFNEDGMCSQDVHFVTRSHPAYEIIYNQNSDAIKQNCRCLEPDLGQFLRREDQLEKDNMGVVRNASLL